MKGDSIDHRSAPSLSGWPVPQDQGLDDQVDILIVADRPEDVAAMETVLEEDRQLCIHKAFSAREALELPGEIDFALVILDLQGAEMTGLEFAERLRSHENTSDVPILFITARDKEEQEIFKNTVIGTMDYLFKPVAPAVLKGKVRIFSELCRQRNAVQAQRRLVEEQNRELEQFVYAASHDLREPLRVVTLYLELLTKRYQGKLDAKADSFIHYAVDGAERMDKLIKGLLSYSRINTSDEPFTAEDTNEIFQAAVAGLSVAVRKSGAVITKDKLPTLSGIRTLLLQLFRNLLDNAVKFAKPGLAPEVHVAASKRQGEWVFSVRDKGIGIEPKYFERIFVIFQRLHTLEEYPGIGIGLALGKRIVERHHGHIWLESKPGEGTTFFFSIPCRE